VPAAPDRKLTREAMKESAADIVDKVISNIIVPHMQGQRHGYLTTCFTQDPKTGLHLLTEEGASMLERTINELAAHAATATMNLRAMVPEQLAGFRFRLGYKVAESDSFYVMPREVKMEYFHQDKVQTHFAVPGLSPRVADVKVELETLVRTLKAKGGEPGTTRQPEAYRNIALLGEHFKAVYGQAVDLEKGTVTVTPDMLASAWKQNYKTALEYVAGTIAVKIMEANMRGSSKRGIPQHPAYDAFFARDERGNFILTDTGRNVLGQMADQCTQRIYADLLRQRPSERGHACRLTYEISGRGSIDYKMEALTLEEAFGPQYARMLGRK
ncbi:hypothetical protein KY359_06420, partial [Candidatus Woesearchaeota archaeon]|nr:hypothetical protein [Candidatus Woesearchaeota archaeon]